MKREIFGPVCLPAGPSGGILEGDDPVSADSQGGGIVDDIKFLVGEGDKETGPIEIPGPRVVRNGGELTVGSDLGERVLIVRVDGSRIVRIEKRFLYRIGCR